MPEIALPTKATQDTIKNGIDTLLNGRVVKSIQRGSFQLTENTSMVTISPVEPLKSILIMNHSFTTSTANPSGTPSGEISNSTTLTFDRFSTTGTALVKWQVIEFY